MARVLTVHRTTVPVGDRAQYLAKLRTRRNHYTSSGCSFWAFEEVGLQGAFLEFTEAGDDQTLRAAHMSLADRAGDVARVYRELELG